MNISTKQLDSEDIEKLLPILSEYDRDIVLFARTKTFVLNNGFSVQSQLTESEVKEKQKQIYNKFTRIRNICNELLLSLDEIFQVPLDAPIEVLDISLDIMELLQRRGEAERVHDVYRLKLTRTLCSAADVDVVNINNLNDSLARIGLPKVAKSSADTEIYRFCDQEYSLRLQESDFILLNHVDWDRFNQAELDDISLDVFRESADLKYVAELSGIPGKGLFPKTLRQAKRILMK